jgi:hypothetical protein
MAYIFGLVALGLVIYGIVHAVTRSPYSEMSEEEFEAEAKRPSRIGPAIMSVQKIFDPSHHVEYVQEENQKVESDSAESGDRPEAGSTSRKPNYKIPE